MGRASLRARLSPAAQADLRKILVWTLDQFGGSALFRYSALLRQALRDLEADPERPGSKARSDIQPSGVRTYHLEFSRRNVLSPGVKRPRHFLLYRSVPGVIEIGRILPDSCDLRRNLPQGYTMVRPPRR